MGAVVDIGCCERANKTCPCIQPALFTAVAFPLNGGDVDMRIWMDQHL